MKVHISSQIMEQIMAMVRAAPDMEICGLLLGSADAVESVVPAANMAPDPSRHFELDPAILLASHRAERQGGPAVIGHYHSHPSGQPVPSRTDAACAAPDGSLWLIATMRQARLWIAQGDEAGQVHFVEAALDIR